MTWTPIYEVPEEWKGKWASVVVKHSKGNTWFGLMIQWKRTSKQRLLEAGYTHAMLITPPEVGG